MEDQRSFRRLSFEKRVQARERKSRATNKYGVQSGPRRRRGEPAGEGFW